MWKKDDVTDPKAPNLQPREEESAPRRDRAEKSGPTQTSGATIGSSITVKGEVSGDEDLLIQGRIEGSVDLKEQVVTVGEEGHVQADIEGRVVMVEGHVEGNLQASEQIVLKSSARVQGDIKAPRVVLEDGAAFRGMVDMGEPSRDSLKDEGKSSFGGSITHQEGKSAESKGGARPSGEEKSASSKPESTGSEKDVSGGSSSSSSGSGSKTGSESAKQTSA